MRILHVACMPFPSMQGTQVYVRGLLKAEAERGHDVALLCYGYGRFYLYEGYQVYRCFDIPWYRNFRAGPSAYKILLDMGIACRLWRLKADIIHVHNYEAPIAAYIKRLHDKTPIVYTAHNLMAEELETYTASQILKTGMRTFGRLLDRTIPRFADHVIAIHPNAHVHLQALGCKYVTTITPGVEKIPRSSKPKIKLSL